MAETYTVGDVLRLDIRFETRDNAGALVLTDPTAVTVTIVQTGGNVTRASAIEEPCRQSDNPGEELLVHAPADAEVELRREALAQVGERRANRQQQHQ